MQSAPSSIPPRIISLLVIVFASAFQVTASPPGAEPISISVSYGASGGVKLEALGREFPEMRSEESAVALKGSWPVPGDGVISLGLYAQQIKFEQDKYVFGVPVIAQPGTTVAGYWTLPLPQKLQMLGVELGYQLQLDEHWVAMLQVVPSWRVAGEATLASKGFGATATALGVCTVRPGLQVTLGASWDSLAEGNNRLSPMLGVDWEISPLWRLAIGVPRTGIFFTPTEKLEVGLVGEGTWSTYYVRDSKAAGRQTYPLGRPLTDLKMEFLEARAGLQVNWQVGPHLGISLTAGAVGLRRIEYPNRKLKLETDETGGGYATVGVNLKF